MCESIGVGDRGAGGAAALTTLEKFAKISNDRAENRPKVGQNLPKQWIFYRAAPLKFISPYAYVRKACTVYKKLFKDLGGWKLE